MGAENLDYEVCTLIMTLLKNFILFHYTNDLICTTRFASLPHKSLLETTFFDLDLYHTNSPLNHFFLKQLTDSRS